MSFKVRFVNLHYSLGEEFPSISEAVQRGKKAGFEFAVDDDSGTVHVGWSTFGGTRAYTNEGREALQLVAEPLRVIAERGGKVIAETRVSTPKAAADWIAGMVEENEK